MIIVDETAVEAPAIPVAPEESTWGAAWRQNSDIGNIIDYVTRPIYQPDPQFDFRARASESQLFQMFPDNFLDAQSDEEFAAIERRVAQELRDRNTLASAGAMGVIAGIATGALSPTILLPGGAFTKGAGALKTGVSVAAWTAVGVGLQEVVLQTAQETRTAEESAMNIGGAALFGGLLGGAFGYLTRSDVDRIAAGMADETISTAIQYPHPSPVPDETDEFLGSTVGAARTSPQEPFGPSAGGLAPSGKVGEALAWISPVARNLQSESPSVRTMQAQISTGGLRLEGNAQGVASAMSGSIEARIGALKAWHAQAIKAFKSSFKERTNRAMSQTDFAKAITRSIVEGVQHADPAVNKAARAIKQELYDKTLAAMREVGIPGLDKLSDEFVEKYLNRVIRPEFARRNSNDLLQILYENSKEKLAESYQKRLEEVTRLAEADEEKAKLIDLPAQDIPAVRAQFEKEMTQLPEQFEPEIADVAREIRALRAEAATSGLSAEKKKALRAEAKQLEAENKELLTPFRAAENKMKARFRLLDHTRAALEAKKEKVLDLIDDLERKQLDSLMSVAKQGQKLLNKIARLEKDVPEAMQAFVEKIERSLAALEKAEARQAKLDPADASDFEATVQKRRVDFAENIAAMEAAPSLDELREAVEETLQDVLLRTNELNNKRAARLAEIRAKAETIDPAQAAVRAAELRAQAAGRIESFTQAMLDKGFKRTGRQVAKDEFGNDYLIPGSGELDFDDLARQHAEITMQHLIGNDQRAPGYTLLLERGPELARTLDIDPYRVWSNGKTYAEFLEDDITKLMAIYSKTTAPDIEIYRKFHTLNPLARDEKAVAKTPIMQNIVKEFSDLKREADKLPEGKREKRLKELDRQEELFLIDTQTQLDRIRHMRGIPADPNGFFYRAGKVMQNVNTLRLLGRMALASVPDLARPIMKAGLLGVLRDSFLPLVSDFKSLKMLKQELNYAGVALDMVLHSRASAMLETFSEIESHSRPERLLQHATNRIGFITLMDAWNVQMQQFAGAVLNAKMMRSIEAVAEGKARKSDLVFLAENNIDANGAALIWQQLMSPGGSTRAKNGVLMPNSENWALDARGMEARALYRAAIYKAVNDTIVLPGVERPSWVDSSQTAKLIAQFRAFTFSSTTKVLIASAQQLRSGDMAPVVGSIFSLALGAFSYYTWARLRGGSDRTKMEEASLETWADEAIRRSGLLAALGEVQKIGDEIPGIRNLINFGEQPQGASFNRDGFVDALGPSIDLINQGWNAVVNAKEDPDKSVHAVRKMMPLQNHFFASAAFDRAEQFFKEIVK